MSRFREWLTQGRPVLGAALLFASVLSTGMLLYEGSGAPAAAGLPRFAGADKLLHFGAHFWVSTLMFWGLAFQRVPADTRKRLLIAALLVLTIDLSGGIAVEFIQSSVGSAHGRVFDGKDVAANALGTVAALNVLAVEVVAVGPAAESTAGSTAEPTAERTDEDRAARAAMRGRVSRSRT